MKYELVGDKNIHWKGQRFEVSKYKRHLYVKLWEIVDVQLMTYLIGPRRVGKSEILKQIINDLIEIKKIPPQQILFYEFLPRDPRELIWELFRYFKKEVTDFSKPTYIFFDEIQFVEGFEILLKDIYDQNPHCKIFITGSLSLSYKRRMKESLVGRFLPYKMSYLSFQEYLELSSNPFLDDFNKMSGEKNNFLKLGYLEKLNPIFKNFLSWGRMPELIKIPDSTKKAYLNEVVSLSLGQDAFSYFDIEKPQTLAALYDYFLQNNGSLVNISNLQVGDNRKTIQKYLDILELMNLANFVYNSKDPITKLNSNRKVYVNSGFYLTNSKLDLVTSMGFAAESYVLERLLESGKQVTFHRQRNKEVDFLLPKEKIAYEVKFRSDTGDLKNLRWFCKKHGFAPKVITLDRCETSGGIEYLPTCMM